MEGQCEGQRYRGSGVTRRRDCTRRKFRDGPWSLLSTGAVCEIVRVLRRGAGFLRWTKCGSRKARPVLGRLLGNASLLVYRRSGVVLVAAQRRRSRTSAVGIPFQKLVERMAKVLTDREVLVAMTEECRSW